MNITIKINTDHAAFEHLPELETARILRALASDFETYGIDGRKSDKLLDENGNTCGSIKVTS